MPKVNWSLDIGHVLQIITVLIVTGISYGSLSAEVKALREEIGRIRGLEIQVARLEAELINRTGGVMRGGRRLPD